jgi:hypothetical protein
MKRIFMKGSRQVAPALVGFRSTRARTLAVTLFAVASLSGCAARLDNTPSARTSYVDPRTPTQRSGVGIESQDIVSMTDKMVRDMLQNQRLANPSRPPRIILDAEYFKNEGHQAINKGIIVDKLRIELLRAAQGRMVFIARHAAEMTEQEKGLRTAGTVTGSPGAIRPQTADFRLIGSIKALSTVDPSRGESTRFHQMTFEMVDLETQEIVWAGIYEYKKAATEDVIYR